MSVLFSQRFVLGIGDAKAGAEGDEHAYLLFVVPQRCRRKAVHPAGERERLEVRRNVAFPPLDKLSFELDVNVVDGLRQEYQNR